MVCISNFHESELWILVPQSSLIRWENFQRYHPDYRKFLLAHSFYWENFQRYSIFLMLRISVQEWPTLARDYRHGASANTQPPVHKMTFRSYFVPVLCMSRAHANIYLGRRETFVVARRRPKPQ
jgi:hypothetical protein